MPARAAAAASTAQERARRPGPRSRGRASGPLAATRIQKKSGIFSLRSVAPDSATRCRHLAVGAGQ